MYNLKLENRRVSVNNNYLDSQAPLVHQVIYELTSELELNEDGFRTLAIKLFKKPSERALSVLKSIINHDGINYPLLYIVASMSSAGLDKNRIFNYAESYNLDFDIAKEHYEHIDTNAIKLLHKFYNEDRITALLSTAIDFIRDALYSLKVISDNTNLNPLKKPKSIYELHENSSELASKIEIGNLALSQREDIIKLEGNTLCNDLIVNVPYTHYELMNNSH